ncbi:aldehyde dehydrogenase-like protein [Talaromyces proteolyticus]|uniref:aldehyde dehydrogenase (NAD(+)) n=1 Tax=Talaromyces proteolyticus TaxID=1131652 RepID=A0AAD4KWA2_9EURO|nr:aldehyde dehydrogenase-like protein [Talaromyces proteolyticus]KAH8701506.1 aldehyde dehydrogenase-like protein [Talaromyces proteolyticus]
MSDTLSFTSFYNVVNGKFRGSETSHHGVDPATQDPLWNIPTANEQDVNDAVQAANNALQTWKKVPFEERVEILRTWGEACKAYLKQFSELITKENGKPKLYGELEANHSFHEAFNYFLTLKIPEEEYTVNDRNYYVRYTPLGVVVAICAWNFPLGQPIMKILPALMAGNCCIVKPSPFSPYSALKVIELAQNYLPPGVLQVLSGDDRLGPWLTSHPDIHKITFTGSTASGKKVAETAAKTLKRITLELGGNNAAIIFPDVDVDMVASEVAMGSFWNTGQVCTAVKRIYIHNDIYPQMLAALAKASLKFKMGPGSEDGVLMGPVQNEMQYHKVKSLFQEARTNSYKVTVGGQVKDDTGFFLEATVIDNPPADSKLVTEEQFGPIVPTLPWSKEEEVIDHVNSTTMGLGASVWTRDMRNARRIAQQLEVGSVYINSYEKVSFRVPFGGHKESGIGYECGPSALVPFCNMQVVHYNFKTL